MKRLLTHLFTAILAAVLATPLAAQTDTTFTYQGRLNDSGVPANGFYSISFELWDALSGGTQVGITVGYATLEVTDGLFAVELDFGVHSYGADPYWIEVGVNRDTLIPRQPLTASPFSIQTRGIYVDENDNVGIGTTSPLVKLHVSAIANDAIVALAHADDAKAVYGLATSTLGESIGVYGLSISAKGHGVHGEGTAYGVSGTSSSTSGVGVRGEATASSGFTEGVFGATYSTEGRGVVGWAHALTGFTEGVYGISLSTGGTGVFGRASASSGSTVGVYGDCTSSAGTGVRGRAHASSGKTYGVVGQSDSNGGIGVRGTTSASSGYTYAVEGRAASTNGRGVYGYATSGSGFTIGVLGKSNSAGGWDFYADGIAGNYGTGSSIRWKNNITNIDNPLDKLARLRGVYFDWDSDHGGQHDVGMIAEEVGAVLPEIVQFEENGIDAIGMDYSKMTPLLVEAVNALRSETNRQLAERDSEISALRVEKDAQIAALRSEKDTEIAELTQRLAELEQLVERLATAQQDEDSQ